MRATNKDPAAPVHPHERIREAGRGAPPALAAVAAWLLRHSAQAAMLGIEDIARACGTSPASVNRFARSAGFAGFSDMKGALAQEMRAVIDPVQKLRDEQGRGSPSAPAHYLAMGHASLDQLAAANSHKDIQAAAKLLATRGRIYVLGFGMTSHVCGWLADALTPYSHSVAALSAGGGTEQSASRMSTIGKGDVLVAISLPRYSLATVELARYARERGARVLAIVDSPAAPLAGEADLCLFACAAHPVLPASHVALQLLCEMLVAEVMRSKPEAVAMAAELTQSIASQLSPG